MANAVPKSIVIAGAGGIGQAVALILAEISETPFRLFIGNRTFEKAEKVVQWIRLGTSRAVEVYPFHLQTGEIPPTMKEALEAGDVLLDCLPGNLAPAMAGLAKDFGMHYANLTEYVEETGQIAAIAKQAKTAFLLQTGLAPGFVNVLANGLLQRFRLQHGVEKAACVAMKVGALTRHATAPHYYGFTWSPAGVATEYAREAVCIRNFKRTTVPSLSERENIIINGVTYEADLTSGGAADLPDALQDKVRRLDYKTLRYPGHYAWVKEQLNGMPAGRDKIAFLQDRMEACVPHVEEDVVLIYASVEGKDAQGNWQRMEQAYNLLPQHIGRHKLRAIQATTAAPLAQAASLLLDTRRKGPVFQSEIDAETFLNGRFVTAVNGEWNGLNSPRGGNH